jgi:hypothetical protein
MSEVNNETEFEIDLFRKSIALVQGIYFVSLIPRLNEFFGVGGWVSPQYKGNVFSLLKFSNLDSFRWILILSALLFLFFLFRGTLNKLSFLFFYLINLSFYTWNPYIQHEAQPIMNLFFVAMFFLPLSNQKKHDPFIKNALIVFLGIYYFLAGIKKLPDKHFLDATAIEGILSWNVMAKNINFNLFLVKYLKWPMRAMTYLTLFFEMSFIFAIFTRFRIYYLLFGVLLHFLIYITIDVGNLSFVMFCWYVLLLDSDTRKKLSNFLEKMRLNLFKIIFKRV